MKPIVAEFGGQLEFTYPACSAMAHGPVSMVNSVLYKLLPNVAAKHSHDSQGNVASYCWKREMCSRFHWPEELVWKLRELCIMGNKFMHMHNLYHLV